MLTFESIRDIERAEKESKKLQKLPQNFLSEVAGYLAKKEQLASNMDLLEVQNVKASISRLIELRERKIVEGALVSARTGTNPENLTADEQIIFRSLADSLKNLRESWKEQMSSRKRLFKVKKAIPEFVGPDLKTYHLKENEIVELPTEVIELLLNGEVIEELQ